MDRFFELPRALGRMVLDTLYPPRCPSCHAPVLAHHQCCAACFAQLRMIADPCCSCCGIPFVVPMAQEPRCPTCLAHPPDYAQARAALVYDGWSAPMISALKFHDQWAGLRQYGQWMRAAAGEMLVGVEAVVPVPLHWRRFWRRMYNQSALLAFEITRETGIACLPNLLRRTRQTKPQMRLPRKERLTNVQGAFAVQAGREAEVAGKIILLVDDVMTTGATVNACAKALLRAGAKEVRVLALARTVLE